MDFLDAGLMPDRWMRISKGTRRFGRIGAPPTMRLVKDFGLIVIRLVIWIFQRPRGRGAVLVLNLFEIALPQLKESGTVDFCIPSDPIRRLWMQRLALAVLPNLFRVVAVLEEDGFGIPILFLLWQKTAALQNQNPLSARGQALR